MSILVVMDISGACQQTAAENIHHYWNYMIMENTLLTTKPAIILNASRLKVNLKLIL